MKLKKKRLRLEQFLRLSFIVFLILLLCGIPAACTNSSKEIAKKALDSTVLLVMEDVNGKPLGFGSGFFVQTNQIVTNFDVIEGAVRGTTKRVGQKTEYNIEGFTAMDEKNDLVILQVSEADVQPLSLGNSDTVEVGDTVYVAGNPKGFFEGTSSEGIISAIRGDSTDKRFQMTAPISPGSSGGPVLNSSGSVIGVSFAIFRGDQILNFVIPSNHLKVLLARLGTMKPLSTGKPSISAKTYFRWGWVKVELGDYKGAIADYDKVIRLKPDFALAYLNRGSAKGKLGQDSAAIADYDTAIRLQPDFADAYVSRGSTKALLGHYDTAIVDLDTAIRLKPEDADAHYNRGVAKRMLAQ